MYKDKKKIPSDEPKICGLDWFEADLTGWDLSNCTLSAEENPANFNKVVFCNAKLHHAKFDFANLKGADFEGANLYEIFFENTNLIYAKKFNRVNEDDPSTARSTYTRLRRYFKTKGEDSRSYDYFYREKVTETKAYWSNTEKSKRNWCGSIRNSASYIFHGFGEKPLRILGWWIGIILLFAILYCCFGEFGKNNNSLSVPENLYFSAVTFTTLGFGDISPSPGNTITQFLAVFEASLGAICVIIFAIVGSRKMFR